MSRLLHSKSTKIIKIEWLGIEKQAEPVKIHFDQFRTSANYFANSNKLDIVHRIWIIYDLRCTPSFNTLTTLCECNT